MSTVSSLFKIMYCGSRNDDSFDHICKLQIANGQADTNKHTHLHEIDEQSLKESCTTAVLISQMKNTF